MKGEGEQWSDGIFRLYVSWSTKFSNIQISQALVATETEVASQVVACCVCVSP